MTSHLIATATDDVVSTWELTREEVQLQHPQVIYESTTTPTAPSTMSSGYGAVNCLGWNHTQQVLACGTDHGTVALLLENGKMLEVLQEPCEARGSPTPIISLAWGKRSRHLLTTGQGKRPSLWDLKGKERIMSFEGHDAPVSTVAFAPEDACVASGDNNGEIILHSIHSPKAAMVLPLDVTDDPAPRTPTGLKAAGVRSLHFWTARQPLLLAGHRDGVARVWDSTAGACLMTFKGQHYMSIVAVAGSPASDKLVVTAGQDRKAILWDVTNRKLLKEVKVGWFGGEDGKQGG
jgi:WD40 repeat protein